MSWNLLRTANSKRSVVQGSACERSKDIIRSIENCQRCHMDSSMLSKYRNPRKTTRWMGSRATWNFLSGIPDSVKQKRCFENASSNVVCLWPVQWIEWLIRLPDAVLGQDQDPSHETILVGISKSVGNSKFQCMTGRRARSSTVA